LVNELHQDDNGIFCPGRHRRNLSHVLRTMFNVYKVVGAVRTDLGIPRVTGIINIPELICNEKDPILVATELRDLPRKTIQGDAPSYKGRRLPLVCSSACSNTGADDD
jgi:hypothetical protein